MTTPHITAERGDSAPAVLMPGDPKRARRTAEALLTDARKVADVRGIGGYTGLYRGRPLPVMVSGMGQPPFAVCTTKLYSFYDVERAVGVGMMDGLAADASPGDVIIALGTHTDSSIVDGVVPGIHFSATASWDLLRAAVEAAGDDPQVKMETIVSRDHFYGDPIEQMKRLAKVDTLGVEVEAAGLCTTATELGKKTLATLTISDLLFDPSRDMAAEERGNKFSKALGIAATAAVD